MPDLNQRCVITVPADLDGGTVMDFYSKLDSLIEERPVEILLDCSDLEHTTSSHISTLWQARQRCQRAGIPVRLSSVRYGLFRILKILNLYELFEFEQGTVESKPGMEKARLGAESVPALRLDFLPSAWAIKDALDRFHDYLRELNVQEICAFDLETVFYEITTNIRLHGQLDDDDCIGFVATPCGDVISLRFIDPGPMFDPTSDPPHFDPDQAIRRRQTSGFGLTMIRRLVDSISYHRRDDGRNVVTLTKKLSRKWRMGL